MGAVFPSIVIPELSYFAGVVISEPVIAVQLFVGSSPNFRALLSLEESIEKRKTVKQKLFCQLKYKDFSRVKSISAVTSNIAVPIVIGEGLH